MNGSENRWEGRRPWRRSPTGGLVFGILIIAVGTIMLLDNLGIVRARDFWDYAPLLLVAIGLTKIVQGQGRPAGLLFGGLLSVAGILWFLENIDVLRFDSRLIWPVIVIGFGVAHLVRALDRQRDPDTGLESPTSQSEVNMWAVFGGSKRVIDSQDFRSGDMFAVFGGVDADFRPARIADTASIDANAVFGGVEIKVPLSWNVELRGSGIFGGYEDKTVHPANDASMPAPKVVVTGFAVFGGVSVSNA
jgi:hypothetical protein